MSLSKTEKDGMDPSKSAKSGDKIQRIPEVGIKKLMVNRSPTETIEELRQAHRERSKQERLELAYENILKDPEQRSGSEDESTDEDYCPENSEDSVTLSEEDSSDDDYTPNGDVSRKRDDASQNESEASEDNDESTGMRRRSKRLASKTA